MYTNVLIVMALTLAGSDVDFMKHLNELYDKL